MKNINRLAIAILAIITISACQKLERPELVLIPDPPKPPYTPLKSYWAFENNAIDSGENKLAGVATGFSYVPGVSGQAVQGTATSNLLIASPGDTIKNLGSFTVSMWVNSGPAVNATGLLAVSNTKEFWGNLEIFYEGFSADATTAYLKVHMYNSNKSTADREAWNEYKIPNWFGKWSHLAITYAASTSTFKIYANGATVYTSIIKNGTYGPVSFTDVGGMVLGSFQFMTTPSLTTNHGAETWARNFAGQMDQVRIYNMALSDAEVSTLFTTKR